MVRKIRSILASGMLGALVLAAPNAMAADGEVVIRSVPIGNLQVLDPIWTSAYITRNHGYLVWDTLFATDENNEVQPQMVDRWTTSDDGLIWTFILRDGLKWHDGPSVTAEDCVASLRR